MATNPKLKTRIGVDNIRPGVMRRLIGAAKQDEITLSAKARQVLDSGLPPFDDVRKDYNRAMREKRGGVQL